MLLSVIFLPKFIGIYSLVCGFLLMSVFTSLLNFMAISKYLNNLSLKTFTASIIYSIPSALLAYFTHSFLKHYLAPIFAISIAGGLSILCILVLYQAFKFIDINDFLPRKLKLNA